MTPVHHQAVAVHRAGDAVLHRLLLFLFHESAEQAIPDDENARVVPVDIFRVAAVVHPVMAGRIEDIFDGRVQFAHQGGVDEVLVHQRQCIAHPDPYRVVTEKGQRHVEQPAAVEDVGGILAHGGGEIHPLGRVVGHMGGPEPAHPV